MNTHNNYNTYWCTFLIVIAVVAIGYLFVHKKPLVPHVETPVVIDSKTKTSTDPSTGVSFEYKEDLGTTYIHTIDWPPKVQVLDTPYACLNAGKEINRAGQTEEKVVNGHIYCITRVSDGAAGSTYTQYAYLFPKDGKVLALTFTLRFVQCANYEPEPRVSCEAERSSFDIDSIADAMATSIVFR